MSFLCFTHYTKVKDFVLVYIESVTNKAKRLQPAEKKTTTKNKANIKSKQYLPSSRWHPHPLSLNLFMSSSRIWSSGRMSKGTSVRSDSDSVEASLSEFWSLSGLFACSVVVCVRYESVNRVTNVRVPSSSSSILKQQLSGSKSLTDDTENEESCDIFYFKLHRHLTQARDKTRTGTITTILIFYF